MELLFQKLQSNDDFSPVERQLAQILLDNKVNIKNLSARKLAQKVYVAPSTVTRFSQKLGYSGFLALKEDLLNERKVRLQEEQGINPNYPFGILDTEDVILSKITTLYKETVKKTSELFEIDNIPLWSRITDFETICIFSEGDIGPLYTFKDKMLKIGRNVVVTSNADQAYYYASYFGKKWLFITVSYSGETPNVLKAASIIPNKNLLIVTSYGGNSLTKLSKNVIAIPPVERLNDNLGNFAIGVAENFIFDFLYASFFKKDFIHNKRKKVEIAKQFQVARYSDNEYLQDRQ